MYLGYKHTARLCINSPLSINYLIAGSQLLITSAKVIVKIKSRKQFRSFYKISI